MGTQYFQTQPCLPGHACQLAISKTMWQVCEPLWSRVYVGVLESSFLTLLSVSPLTNTCSPTKLPLLSQGSLSLSLSLPPFALSLSLLFSLSLSYALPLSL